MGREEAVWIAALGHDGKRKERGLVAMIGALRGVDGKEERDVVGSIP